MYTVTWILLAISAIAVVLLIISSKNHSPSDQPIKVKEGVSQEEIDKEISGMVDCMVGEGFEPREEIIWKVTEFIEDEYGLEGVRERVVRETDQLIEKHLNNQLSWPEQTDCDRIDAVFAALETKGIIARQNFTCCNSCGIAEIGDEIRGFAKKAKPMGYTFYHMQDTERAYQGGPLFLAFGTVDGTDGDTLRVGEIVRDTLTEHGLTVEWDGSLDKRICVTGLDWKRRRKQN
jgi:hypothetical protein